MLQDEDRLQEALSALRGAAVTRVVLGAGELFVEFGQSDGISSLGTGGSAWALVDGDQLLVQDTDDVSALERFTVAFGRSVLDAQSGGDSSGRTALKVDLGDDLLLFILGSPPEDASALPVFELSTPRNRVVSLHSDGLVEDFPSDVPIDELLASGLLHRWPSE